MQEFDRHLRLSRPEVRAAPRPADDDGPLLRRMKAGDLDAFETFFGRHRVAVYRTAYALLRDEQLAEEVLQDTFVRAYNARQTLREDVSPVPWLHRVALNLCYSILGRKSARWEPISDALVKLVRDGQVGPDEHAERMELRVIVRDGILTLPPHQQAVVVLYYIHGLSLQETAETLDLPLGTVKSRLHYGLATLRERLEGDRRFNPGYRVALRRADAR